ncbi:hypothetical protein MSZK_43470 [Mycobacterium sp. shizuoka-1]|jgi:hypothetical protein|nr:hypothetical protein MSZK_43470 [Mycobacterium sp. shizuoka-1]
MLDRARDRFVESAVSTAADPVTVAGHLTIPNIQRASWCSRTAAEAAATARATDMSPTF